MHWWRLLHATEIRRFQRTCDDLELHAMRIPNVSTTEVKHNLLLEENSLKEAEVSKIWKPGWVSSHNTSYVK